MEKVKTLSVYVECSSGVAPKVETLKKFISIVSKMGYKEFYLGLTDAYKIDEYPYFNYKRGSYSKEELHDLEQYCFSNGMRLVPAIQVLGHLEFIWRHQSFRDFMDTKSILEVGNPKSYDFVDKMLKSISSSFEGRRIHIGMDETFGIGTGEYLKRNPPKDKKELLLEYLKEVVKIARKYHLEIEIWGDMLVDKELTKVTPEMVKAELPEGTLTWLWDYDTTNKRVLDRKIKEMEEHSNRIGYAGCAWKHTGYVPSNTYSIPRIISQIDECGRHNIDKYMVTMWGDNALPCSIFSTLPSLFIAAENNQGFPVTKQKLNKQKFLDITGIAYDDMFSCDYLNNPYHHDRTIYYNNTSFIAFFSDLFIGNYDLYASKEVNKKYKQLSSKYRRIAKKGTYYTPYFEMLSKYAEILSMKVHLGENIREAYYAKDKARLTTYAKKDITHLIMKVKSFIGYFDSYFLNENQALGIEVSQEHHNHLLGRLYYIKKRIMDYVNNDVEIDEIKQKTLIANYIPSATEDCYLNNIHDWLVSYNFRS